MGGIIIAWLAVHQNGREGIFTNKPIRQNSFWWDVQYIDYTKFDTEISLPKGSIKKLLGRDLTWGNEPVELKMEK